MVMLGIFKGYPMPQIKATTTSMNRDLVVIPGGCKHAIPRPPKAVVL
jgi:hypothetical protein